ncbi:MAG: transcriptional regulator, LysR family [Verrucomicrobiales bacterium]|nr:transcriptional regulator, LysR family [Verrucomicrobiales bacterium]
MPIAKPLKVVDHLRPEAGSRKNYGVFCVLLFASFVTSMELRHLKYFVAVAEELSFSGAAERVRVAQPALSAQIRSLENELGVQLLERHSRGVALTQVGKVFLREARLTIQQAERAATSAKEAAQGLLGELRIGCITSFTNEHLLQLVRAYRTQFPKVDLRFLDKTPAGLEEAVVNKDVDVAFLRPPVRDSSLNLRVVEHAEMVIVMPKTHALAAAKSLSWEQLKDETFIQLSDQESPGFNGRFREYALKAGFVPRIAHYGHEMHSILWHVEVGLGIAVMVSGMKDLLRRDLVIRSFKKPVPTIETLMVWRKEDTSPTVAEFVRLSKAHLLAE